MNNTKTTKKIKKDFFGEITETKDKSRGCESCLYKNYEDNNACDYCIEHNKEYEYYKMIEK